MLCYNDVRLSVTRKRSNVYSVLFGAPMVFLSFSERQKPWKNLDCLSPFRRATSEQC